MSSPLESIPCGYLQFSEDCTILTANTHLAKLLCASKQDLEGQNIRLILPKAGQIFFQSYVFPQLKIKGQLNECYFNLRHADGSRLPVLSNFCRQEQPDGTYLYSAVIMHVKKRHDLEDALVRAKGTTDKAISALKKSNDTLARFANMVAHDLKAPMRHMKSLSSFIREDYAHLLDQDGQNLLDNLGKSANRAIHFVEKLLEYGSLNTQNDKLNPVDLHTIVDTACDTLADNIAATSATLHIAPLPTVMGIETQLTQLFQNLISNALKYSKPNVPPKIEIQAIKISNREWEISIQDNGIGIPAEYQANVFDIMYRLHGSDYEGAGIGLATCQWIVRNHLGAIGVGSTIDEGSRFYFTLLADKEQPDLPQPTESHSIHGSNPST